MIVDCIDFLKTRQRAVRAWCFILMGLALVWVIVAVDNHHAHTWMEAHIPWFWSIFGVVAGLALIFFARWFGGSGIMTREDYYDD